jgi:hypothetical protein
LLLINAVISSHVSLFLRCRELMETVINTHLSGGGAAHRSSKPAA